MLTAKEMKELNRLTAKARQSADPLNEINLQQMESHVAEFYDFQPEMMKSFGTVWNEYVKWMKVLSNDNARLIYEVRRLTE